MNRTLSYYITVSLQWLLTIPVMLTTYAGVWLDRKLKFPLSFPRDVAALAKEEEWCIKELKKNGVLPAGAKVFEYKVTPLNQNVIFRSNAGIASITYSEDGENKTLQCFAKFAPTMGTVWNRTIFNLQFNHIKEIFFNQYFIKTDKIIPAPRVYCSKVSVLTGNLCLITEYMSDCMEYEGVSERLPQQCLELTLEGMASLHARFWKNTSKEMKKIFPIEDKTVYWFDSVVAFSWSEGARQVLIKSWHKMNERETVLHGDARIGNMMFPKREGTGRFVFIDWQAVHHGKAVFDLAYFLILSLITEHRQEAEQQYMDTYYRHLVSKGVSGYPREELEEDYRHACLCVLVLLSLPMLSGEVSADGEAAQIFKWGMGVWRERMQAKFDEFDYIWMANRYEMTEQQGREAVAEMLRVIENRLNRIEGTTSLN